MSWGDGGEMVVVEKKEVKSRTNEPWPNIWTRVRHVCQPELNPTSHFLSVVASLLIIFQVIVLLCMHPVFSLFDHLLIVFSVSELGWPAVFFNRFFPVLGRNFGLGALGIFQCLCVQ